MKKLTLVTAIAAATLSAGAHAERAVNAVFSNGGVAMFVNNTQLVITCPAGSQVFSIDGAASNQIQMQGDICLDPYGSGTPWIRLRFNTTGGYSPSSPMGVVFVLGSINIDVQTTDGWFPYGLVDVSLNNIACIAGTGTGHLGTNDTAGLQLSSGTSIPLPGIWDGVASSPSEDSAACVTTLFGNSAGLFLDGTIKAP